MHYVALVITENGTYKEVEEALQPFHEFECTRIEDQHVQEIDVTTEAFTDFNRNRSRGEYKNLKEYLSEYWEFPLVAYGNAPDIERTHKYGYALEDERCAIYKVIHRTNPNAKWDFWQVGGRWNERHLLHKNGTGVNRCMKSEVDEEGMIKRHMEQEEYRWGITRNIVGDNFNGFRRWEEVLKESPNLDVARYTYNTQLAVHIWRTRGRSVEYPWNLDSYAKPLEDIIERARSTALSTYAILVNGIWHERGGKKIEIWDEEFLEIWKDIPDNKHITLVDYHI